MKRGECPQTSVEGAIDMHHDGIIHTNKWASNQAHSFNTCRDEHSWTSTKSMWRFFNSSLLFRAFGSGMLVRYKFKVGDLRSHILHIYAPSLLRVPSYMICWLVSRLAAQNNMNAKCHSYMGI